mmetsp:Transcript_29359/g.64708  ORF Transcript_29359/g.64708 Transcript_29359/m.64708 type:complete len:264 (-) Transcript_29359:258-1049(-)
MRGSRAVRGRTVGRQGQVRYQFAPCQVLGSRRRSHGGLSGQRRAAPSRSRISHPIGHSRVHWRTHGQVVDPDSRHPPRVALLLSLLGQQVFATPSDGRNGRQRRMVVQAGVHNQRTCSQFVHLQTQPQRYCSAGSQFGQDDMCVGLCPFGRRPHGDPRRTQYGSWCHVGPDRHYATRTTQSLRQILVLDLVEVRLALGQTPARWQQLGQRRGSGNLGPGLGYFQQSAARETHLDAHGAIVQPHFPGQGSHGNLRRNRQSGLPI